MQPGKKCNHEDTKTRRTSSTGKHSSCLRAVVVAFSLTKGSLENALRHLHVDADDRSVDELRDGDVARDAHELIRLMLRQLLGRGQEIHHLLNGERRRDFEILV